MIEQIHPSDLQGWTQKVQALGRPLVLDVREPAELLTAKIKPSDDFDFLHIPMAAVPPRVAELDRNRPIACLCHHGGRSMRVAEFLVHQGYTHVANIAGGIEAWSTQVDPSIPRY